MRPSVGTNSIASPAFPYKCNMPDVISVLLEDIYSMAVASGPAGPVLAGPVLRRIS